MEQGFVLHKKLDHVAFIMDGNGRWAKKRMQPRIMGHKAGMDALQKVTKTASDLGVRVLTVYAFSTENWSRPEKEVKFIMNLPVEFYDKYVPELHANNVKIQMIGDYSKLPQATLNALYKAEQKTKNNTGLILNFALNYGGRDEVTRAVKAIAQDVLDAKFNSGDIDEKLIAVIPALYCTARFAAAKASPGTKIPPIKAWAPPWWRLSFRGIGS
jgi:undecaprenyl diphosphate synthase